MDDQEIAVDLRRLPVQSLGIEEGHRTLAGQLEWCAYLPMLHRVLANPGGGETLCDLPLRTARHEDFISYWFAALYLLVYSFGWSRPGRGLKWWFDSGRPTEDVRFRLLRRVWDRNDHLDLLAAWLWTTPKPIFSSMAAECFSWHPGSLRDLRIDPGEEWWARFNNRFPDPFGDEKAGVMPFDPYHGGGDPMHLALHIGSPLQTGRTTALLLRSEGVSRRAVLMLEGMQGWFGHLSHLGATLPDIGNHSWHVDVFCKPVGWLGTYRQSRQTGTWFAGRHRYHTVGN